MKICRLNKTKFHILFAFAIVFICLVQSCKVKQKVTHEKDTDNNAPAKGTLNKSSEVIKNAHYYDGAPYKMGGESKSGIDCSGLVMVSYKKAGITLPRTSMEQSKTGKEITLDKALPGDLIFFRFKKTNKNPVNHVGIISKKESWGATYFVHASSTLGVTESSLSESYYHDAFVKVMRVLE